MRRGSLALGLLSLAAIGCTSDESHMRTGPNTPAPPSSTALGEFMIDVNLKTNQITVTPVGSAVSTPAGVNAVIYGGSGRASLSLTATGLVPDPSTPGQSVDTLRMSMENLLTNGIGTMVPNTVTTPPGDTVGIFTVVTVEPTPTAGCVPSPGCTVSITNQAGDAPFTTPTPQSYWYRQTILQAFDGALDSAGPDYAGVPPARDAQVWAFRAIGSVSNFKFGVSFSTPWTPPNGNTETKWIIPYIPDSLPNRGTEPPWRFERNQGGGPAIVTVGCPGGATQCLRLVTHSAGNGTSLNFYHRGDSLGATQSGFIAAVVGTMLILNDTVPTIFMGLQDNVKMAQVGFSRTKVGFIDADGAFIGTTVDPTTLGDPTSWRVAKLGNTSAQLFAPASSQTPLITIAYAMLPAPSFADTPPTTPFFWFGNFQPKKTVATASLWSSVVYGIGSPTP